MILACGFLTQTLPLMLAVVMAMGGVFLAWHAPRFMGFLTLATGPLIGWLWSISLKHTTYGERLFAGSLDLPVSDVVAFAGVFAVGWWLIRTGEWRSAWRRFPFLGSYAALVAAHLASVFSRAEPDPLGVFKFTFRPVAFAYIAYVALPSVVLRSWRDVRLAFGVFVGGASLFALQGLVSLIVNEQWSLLALHRARPLAIFGVFPIGVNHNVLAEWLVVAAPFALALAAWTHEKKLRSWLYAAAFLCMIVALLTFARSAWIVVALELFLACATVWRSHLSLFWKRVRRGLWLCILPLVGYMGWFSLRSEVASSTDARAMLAGIAWDGFSRHPLFGMGAGTFVARVGETWSYQLLFGGAMDGHGIIPKLALETGLVGLLAYAVLSYTIAHLVLRAIREVGYTHRMGQGLVFAAIGATGAWTYQLFNTTYWTAKLWLPIGLVFAAMAMMKRSKYV